jgi:hypothetical protein
MMMVAKIQHRTITAPCCGKKVRVAYPRGTRRANWSCTCGKRYQLTFRVVGERTYNLVKKEVLKDGEEGV